MVLTDPTYPTSQFTTQIMRFFTFNWPHRLTVVGYTPVPGYLTMPFCFKIPTPCWPLWLRVVALVPECQQLGPDAGDELLHVGPLHLLQPLDLLPQLPHTAARVTWINWGVKIPVLWNRNRNAIRFRIQHKIEYRSQKSQIIKNEMTPFWETMLLLR